MPRPYTGADFVHNAIRLSASQFMRSGILRIGEGVHATVKYGEGTVEVKARWQGTHGDGKGGVWGMDLVCTFPDPYGDPVQWSQYVNATASPSNLGRGNVAMFVCPETGDECRYLYRAYHSRAFRSRKGYARRGLRLYYPGQTGTAFQNTVMASDRLEAKLSRLEEMRYTETYKGRPTKRAERITKLSARLDHVNRASWSNLAGVFAKLQARARKA